MVDREKSGPITRRGALAGLVALGAAGCARQTGGARAPGPARRALAPWREIERAARGQTVYFNAWGGDNRVNAYVEWAAAELGRHAGVKLVHVKTQDTAEAVARVVAEMAAGRREDGSVDLIWINGENFAALKARNLLAGPFVERLPAAQFVDFAHQPAFSTDFTIPVEGYEAPWGLSYYVFTYDAARTPAPPRDFLELALWVRTHPGRFTYPAPPDFIGSTFLKQALLSLSPAARTVFAVPPADSGHFAAITAPLWAYLDAMRPFLWRKGAAFPANGPAQRQLLADGEVDLAMAFNPSDARTAIATKQLPPSARTYSFRSGSISNAHFLAIPVNAKAAEGAMVVADFMLSAAAQARKSDIRVWGDCGVLAVDRLPAQDQALFAALDQSGFLARADRLGPVLQEPHPAWMEALEQAWLARYGAK